MIQRIVKILKWYITSLILLFLMVFLIPFYFENAGEKSGMSINFPATSFDSQSININTYEGKVVLVDFWFSGCQPCLEEMKFYPELTQKHKDLAILSLSVDSPEHTKKLLELKPVPWDFLPDNNPNWAFFNVDRKELEKFNIQSFPTYFIINKEGNLISSPKSGLYMAERYLGSVFSTKLSMRKYFDNSKKNFIKLFRIFNILFFLILLVVITIRFVRGKLSKR